MALAALTKNVISHKYTGFAMARLVTKDDEFYGHWTSTSSSDAIHVHRNHYTPKTFQRILDK